jgi:serine/threonine protein kinase
MRSDPTTAPVLPGETLAGKYKIERILGRGGMGIVVAARHLELEERVAIKFLLRGGTGGDPAVLERFLREARAAAKVKNEHVCRVFDVGRLESGEPYLVMEYLEGIDLADKLDANGPLSVTEAASFLIEACAALAEAHAMGIVHRDLKPANIFLAKRSDGSTCVKVLDFGISKWTESDAMTATSALIGSPAYMSPEQIVSARTVDRRADIWSLGVVLHELVAGAPPFEADTVLQLSIKIREQPPDLLRDVVPHASKEIHDLEAVVAKCLTKDPEQRYADMSELARALGPFADPETRRLVDKIRSHNGNISNSSIDAAAPRSPPVLELDAAFSATMLSDDGRNAELLVQKTKAQPQAQAKATAAKKTSEEPSATPVGHVTLEPLSRLSRAEEEQPQEIKKPRRLLSIGAFVAVAVIAGVSAWRLTPSHGSDAPAVIVSSSSSLPTPDPSTMALPPPNPSTNTNPDPIPAASSTATTAATTAAKPSGPHAARTAGPITPSASAATSASPSSSSPVAVAATIAPSSPPPTPAPTPEASSRRKRNLDRSDPYERDH